MQCDNCGKDVLIKKGTLIRRGGSLVVTKSVRICSEDCFEKMQSEFVGEISSREFMPTGGWQVVLLVVQLRMAIELLLYTA